jgi:hypothetical protein
LVCEITSGGRGRLQALRSRGNAEEGTGRRRKRDRHKDEQLVKETTDLLMRGKGIGIV